MDLQPDWVVGFVDGEGCFYVDFTDHPEMTAGYQVLPEFRVEQHERDKQILYGLKRFFKNGVVRRNHEEKWELRIRNLEGLREIVKFFRKHPLKTKKSVDFHKFAKIIEAMNRGKHLTPEGLLDLVHIAKGMNTQKNRKLNEVEKSLRDKLRGKEG